MKRLRFATLLAVFVFAVSALVASATTNSGPGAAAAITNPVSSSTLDAGLRTTTLLLIASAQPPDHTAQSERQDERDRGRDHRGRDKGKDKFHGAEMGPAAIVLAGLFAVSAYFFVARRRAHTHV